LTKSLSTMKIADHRGLVAVTLHSS
jgi:hypothetical protein